MNIRALNLQKSLKRLSALGIALGISVFALNGSNLVQAQDPYDNLPNNNRPYDNRPYGNSPQGQYPRPQNTDRARAERDYIVQENDPYLAPQQQMSPRQQYCRQLEQKLARDWNSRNRGMEDLPRIQEEMRKARGTYRKLERRAERKKCYEYFLFSKTVRRTRRCYAMHKKIQEARRKLAGLEGQHQKIMGGRSSNNFQRNGLVASLARNGCGQQYNQAARNNSWGIFDFLQNNNTRVDPRGRLERHHMPFATYRTMCVRMCDGYYFPVSFSAMQSKFSQDDNTCQSKCAAPAKLFVYENPGGSVENMTSVDGIAYSELPNAWRYRKTYVKGCSCKLADYDPVALQNLANGRNRAGGNPANQSTGQALGAPNIGNGARSVAKPQAKVLPKPESTQRTKGAEGQAPKILAPAPKRAGPRQQVKVPVDPMDAIAQQLARSEMLRQKSTPLPQ